MKTRLINKENISALITDVQNIDDSRMNREIDDTQEFDFRKQVPSEFYDAVIAVKELNVRAWSRTKTYADADKVIHDGRMWVGVGTPTGVPGDDNNTWSEIVLYRIFTTYIVPFLTFVAYSKYSVEHGLSASPKGFAKISDPNMTSIDARERAMIVNKYQNRGDKYFMDFMSWMSANNFTVDGVQYTFNSTTTRRISPKIKFKGV